MELTNQPSSKITHQSPRAPHGQTYQIPALWIQYKSTQRIWKNRRAECSDQAIFWCIWKPPNPDSPHRNRSLARKWDMRIGRVLSAKCRFRPEILTEINRRMIRRTPEHPTECPNGEWIYTAVGEALVFLPKLDQRGARNVR